MARVRIAKRERKILMMMIMMRVTRVM
jgi:hypothetical protein